jgi:formate dehydrogenase maturation protein FdhE
MTMKHTNPVIRRQICPRCPRCENVMDVHTLQGRTWWSCSLCDTLRRRSDNGESD